MSNSAATKPALLGGKKRARTAKEKDLRRESLLAAALQLLLENRGCLPTVNAIAAQAGVAKGTAYIYFNSKEAIYMSLLEQQLYTWLDDVRHHLRFVRGDLLDGVIEALLCFQKKQPHLWILASLGHLQLEPAIDKKDLLSHKTKLAQGYRATARYITQIAGLPESHVDEAQARLIQSYAYLLGCWQLAEPPVAIKSLLKGPGLTALQPDFLPLAQQGLYPMWRSFFTIETAGTEKTGMLKRLFQRS